MTTAYEPVSVLEPILNEKKILAQKEAEMQANEPVKVPDEQSASSSSDSDSDREKDFLGE